MCSLPHQRPPSCVFPRELPSRKKVGPLLKGPIVPLLILVSPPQKVERFFKMGTKPIVYQTTGGAGQKNVWEETVYIPKPVKKGEFSFWEPRPLEFTLRKPLGRPKNSTGDKKPPFPAVSFPKAKALSPRPR